MQNDNKQLRSVYAFECTLELIHIEYRGVIVMHTCFCRTQQRTQPPKMKTSTPACRIDFHMTNLNELWNRREILC